MHTEPPIRQYPISKNKDHFPQNLLIMTATSALAVLAPLLANPTVSQTWDGLLHSSIVNSIAHFGIPPRTLYFPGYPLVYHWLPDLFVYWLTKLFRTGFFAVWPWYSCCLSLVLQLAMFRVSRQLGLRPGFALLAASLGMFGMNIAAPLFFTFRTVFQGGLDLTKRAFSTYEFGSLLAWGYDTRARGMLPKFYDPSGFPTALALSVVCLSLLLTLLTPTERGRRLRFELASAAYAAAVGLLLFANPLSAWSFLVAVLAGLVSVRLVVGEARRPRRLAAVVLVNFVLLSLVTLQLLSSPALGSGSGENDVLRTVGSAHLFLPALGALALPPLAAWILIGAGLLNSRNVEIRSRPHLVLLGGVSICYALGLFAHLPGGNQYKFAFHLHLFALLPGVLLVQSSERRKSKAGLASVVAMMIVLMVWGVGITVYGTSRAQPGGADGLDSSAAVDVGRWVEEHTPIGSVFLEGPYEYSIVSAFGGRATYIAFADALRLHGYPAESIDGRIAVKKTMERSALAESGIDFIVVPREVARELDYTVVYRNASYVVLKVRP